MLKKKRQREAKFYWRYSLRKIQRRIERANEDNKSRGKRKEKKEKREKRKKKVTR
jgi:hypothetical protein